MDYITYNNNISSQTYVTTIEAFDQESQIQQKWKEQIRETRQEKGYENKKPKDQTPTARRGLGDLRCSWQDSWKSG